MNEHPGHRRGTKAGYKPPSIEAAVGLRQALQCIALAQQHLDKRNHVDAVDQANMAIRFLEEFVERYE